jgi:hypothetical protein
MKEKLINDKSYIIYKDPTTDQTHVNEKHAYWHQIQRQMHITGRSKCYLVIGTTENSKAPPNYLYQDPFGTGKKNIEKINIKQNHKLFI